jgi:hypothetical protein
LAWKAQLEGSVVVALTRERQEHSQFVVRQSTHSLLSREVLAALRSSTLKKSCSTLELIVVFRLRGERSPEMTTDVELVNGQIEIISTPPTIEIDP